MGNIRDTFQQWLAEGGERIGEVHIADDGARFRLTHWQDAGRSELTPYHRPEDARQLANTESNGEYRPLKTAPNLRRGWALELAGIDAVILALDFFYPAMLGIWVAHRSGGLQPVALRETLNRQTGMYAVTKKISDDAADRLIGAFCNSCSGCLKTILWQIDPAVPITSLPAAKFDPHAEQLRDAQDRSIPLFCQEACNLLVAVARKVVKEPSA